MKNHQNIKSWSEDDRPREKLLAKGPSALSDVELIAILIGSGHRNATAVEVSREILSASDHSLDDLGKQSVGSLMVHKGIGEAKAITLVAAMEIGRRRALTKASEDIYIKCSRDAYEAIGPKLIDLSYEEMWLLLLNRRGKLLRKVKIGQGGVGKVVVDKGIIFKHAIESLAKSIILVHNHPSGLCNPSAEDKKLTNDCVEGGKYLDINIADHIIVGGHSYFSFLDEGML